MHHRGSCFNCIFPICTIVISNNPPLALVGYTYTNASSDKRCCSCLAPYDSVLSPSMVILAGLLRCNHLRFPPICLDGRTINFALLVEGRETETAAATALGGPMMIILLPILQLYLFLFCFLRLYMATLAVATHHPTTGGPWPILWCATGAREVHLVA